jgi:hypothetical protein
MVLDNTEKWGTGVARRFAFQSTSGITVRAYGRSGSYSSQALTLKHSRDWRATKGQILYIYHSVYRFLRCTFINCKEQPGNRTPQTQRETQQTRSISWPD